MRSRHAVILDRREGIHAFSVSSHSRPEGVNPRVFVMQSFSTGGSESMRLRHAEGLCPEASSYGLLRFIAYKSYVVAEVFVDARKF